MRILLVGGGGRESAVALKLAAENCAVHAVMPHNNPTIAECIRQTGGAFLIGDYGDPSTVANFAIETGVDYAFVNADEPLANGVVNHLLERGIKAIGGTREAARIEWDKVYAMRLMETCLPQFTPLHRVAADEEELRRHVGMFQSEGVDIVVKPKGLTGGKGVKVMPEHLPTYADCVAYGQNLLSAATSEQVLLTERLRGVEFTVMGFTDGESLAFAPASYDYPYRFPGDKGPGTGGMGCFTAETMHLPFMTTDDMNDCRLIMQTIIDILRRKNNRFQGVINGGFFKTRRGIKMMEFNSRLGDPEGINIMSVFGGSFSSLLRDIWHRRLRPDSLRFSKQASVVKYMTAREYPDASPAETFFELPLADIQEFGASVYFSSAEKTPNGYKTLRRSRVFALGAVADSVNEAAEKVNEAFRRFVFPAAPTLDYRSDIGAENMSDFLTRL